MVRADRQPVGYPADALQRAETRDWRHLTAHVDADAARPGARRPDNAHDFSDSSTARRLRTDPPWALKNIARIETAREKFDNPAPRKPAAMPVSLPSLRQNASPTGTTTGFAF